MPWVFLFRHRKPAKHVEYVPNIKSWSKFYESNNKYLESLGKLIKTFTPEQYRLYGEIKEYGQQSLMFKPD